MDEAKKYSVSELAELVGVPRTTINDWLGRYPQYIDFSMQGRRKVYSDASVAVLREILELRNSGLSSFDIETQLAKRHAVHGEAIPPEQFSKREAQPPSPAERQEDKTRQAQASAPHPGQQQGEEYALIVKKQTDEIARLLGEHLQNLSRRMDEIERHNREATARAQRWYFVAILLALALASFGVFAAVKINASMIAAQKDRNDRLLKDAELQSMEKEFVTILRGTEDDKKTIAELEKTMKKQAEDFARQIEEAKKNPATASEAENLLKRNELAGEKLEELKKLLETPTEKKDAQPKLPATPPPPRPGPNNDKTVEILSIGAPPEIKP